MMTATAGTALQAGFALSVIDEHRRTGRTRGLIPLPGDDRHVDFTDGALTVLHLAWTHATTTLRRPGGQDALLGSLVRALVARGYRMPLDYLLVLADLAHGTPPDALILPDIDRTSLGLFSVMITVALLEDTADRLHTDPQQLVAQLRQQILDTIPVGAAFDTEIPDA